MAPGTYFVLACADDLSLVSESSEANNCRASSTTVQITAATPDLTVTAVSDPPASAPRGGTFAVTDTVANQTAATASASSVRYYLSLDTVKGTGDWLLTGTRSAGVLGPQGTSSGTVTVTVPMTVTLATYFLLACADDLGQVTESSETNNCLPSVTTVQVTGADLTVTAVSDPPASAPRGSGFAVTDTVVNQAAATATASSVRYYLSLDTVKNTGDVLLTGTRSVGALAPQATSSGTVTVTVPTTAALTSYFLLACADDLAQVAENSETNNCRASAATVTVTP
jgi:subtilase family serine protease